MTQLSMPNDVTPQEVAREHSLGGAIDLCARAAGLLPKEIQARLKIDKAQWSRWISGQEGVVWPRMSALMDECGNDAPVFWMLHHRGWELTSLRRQETELERQVREATERALKAEEKFRLAVELLHGRGV